MHIHNKINFPTGHKDSSVIVKDNAINKVNIDDNQFKLDNKLYMQIKSMNRVCMHNNLTFKSIYLVVSYIDISKNRCDISENKTYDALSYIKKILLNNFKKIKKIEKGLCEYNKNIMNSLSKLYSNDRIKLYELKKVNANVNLLLGHTYLLIYNKKRDKESIIENANLFENIKKYVKFIDLKFVKVVNIEKYLYETIDIIHNKFKYKQCYGILNEFSKITIYIIKSLKNTYNNSTKKKINGNSTNKKIISDNSTKKKIISDNNTKKKIINDNSTNKKITSDNITNKKIINDNSTNKKITSDNITNKKIINDNSTNKKFNDNSTNKINIYMIILSGKEKNMIIVLLKKIYMKIVLK